VKRLGLVVAVVIALYAARCVVLPRLLPPGDVEYRGEKVKLSKWYFDYDDYKNDPENIAAFERVRVQRLVATAPIERAFDSRMRMLTALSALRFPGYGSSQFGEKAQADGSLLAGFSVEIPTANQERVLVFRGRDGVYTLVDDFLAPADPVISSVRQETDQFVYGTREGREVLRRRADAP
jgi:hypothetical protein